jgi:hypothetical protein
MRSFSGFIPEGFQPSAGSNHQSVTVLCLSAFGFQFYTYWSREALPFVTLNEMRVEIKWW